MAKRKTINARTSRSAGRGEMIDGLRCRPKKSIIARSITGLEFADSNTSVKDLKVSQVPDVIRKRFREVCHLRGTTMRIEILAFMWNFIRAYGDESKPAGARTNSSSGGQSEHKRLKKGAVRLRDIASGGDGSEDS